MVFGVSHKTYLTRQLIALTKDLEKRLADLTELLNRHAENLRASMDAKDKRAEQQQHIFELRFHQILTKRNESERNENTKEERNYGIQKSIKRATWVAAWAAIGALGAGCTYAYLTYRQWQTAKDTLEAETRPWIGIDGDLQIKSQQAGTGSPGGHIGMYLEFSIKMRNYGQSPAIRVVPVFQLRGEGIPRDLITRSKACEEAGASTIQQSPVHVYDSIFPGSDGFTKDVGANSDPLNPDPAMNSHWLVGCIAYRRSAGGQIYYTRLIYELAKQKDPASSPDGTKYYPIVGIKRFDIETE